MKQVSSAMRSYLILTVLYLLLTLVLPANKVAMHEYHLSTAQYHILLFIVVLPLVAVWCTAFYGYAKLRQFAQSIAHTKEGKGYSQLTRSFKWLAWGFPIPAIISLLLNSIVNAHPGFKPADVIMNAYITLLIPLVSFTLLSNGAKTLFDTFRLHVPSIGQKAIVALFVVLGVMYCYLTFRQLNLHDNASNQNPFYLPTWLMVLTITIPYLFAWFSGLIAASEIAVVSRHTQGILYRRQLRILALGIVLVVAGSIALQYVTSITPHAAHLTLNSILVTGYAVRFVAGAGYVLIAVGATRMRKIEEV